jgi:hypothetical protein
MGARATSLGPECPRCGIKSGKCIRSGTDSDGHPVRTRECRDCGERYTTVEVVVPDTKFENLDVERKMYQKLHMREKRGYWGQKARKFPVTYRLLVAFRVIQGTRVISEYSEMPVLGRPRKVA